MLSSTSTTAFAGCALALLSLLTVPAIARSHDSSLLSRRLYQHEKRLNAMTYEGCFSSSSGLTDQGSYQYQTSGYCQPLCVDQNMAVLATGDGSDCYCGNLLPPADSKVSDSYCNVTCNGYGSENCGGDGYYSVYLSGTEDSVANEGSSSSTSSSAASATEATSTSSSAAAATTSSTSTTAATTAIVVTSVAPGETVVVTQPASADSSSSASPTAVSKKKSTNVAGVAAGVVVGILAAVALIVGALFYVRNKKRRQAEEDYRRANQVSDFMRGTGDLRPPPTAYSNMSDSRLDPEVGRNRNSVGSIADDQDYSRRILRVANPDDH